MVGISFLMLTSNELLEGIKVAEEGERIIEWFQSQGFSSTLFGPYYGCLGEIYDRLKDHDNCLRAYLKDLEYREKQLVRSNNSHSKMSLVGGEMNVARAYENYGTAEYYSIARNYYLKAIDLFEEAMQEGAEIKIPDMPVNMYINASKNYILKSKGQPIKEEELNSATLHGIYAIDYAKQYFRDFQSPKAIQLIEEAATHTSKMVATSAIEKDIISATKRWIIEDENQLSIENNDAVLNAFILLQSYFVAANLIEHSKYKEHYNFAHECWNDGYNFKRMMRRSHCAHLWCFQGTMLLIHPEISFINDYSGENYGFRLVFFIFVSTFCFPARLFS